MQPSASDTYTVTVDAEVYDVLNRTAAARDTDVNGALHYLTEAPAVPAAPTSNDED